MWKLHLLVTLGGLIVVIELAAAHFNDIAVGFELLLEYTDLIVLGDKGYISAPKGVHLWHQNRIKLRTLLRSNQKP